MIVLWPALFWWTLVFWLPPSWMTDCLGRKRLWRRTTQPGAQSGHRGKRNCRICAGLSFLYIVIMIVAIVVPIKLANNPSTIISITLAKDPWAGSYVVLDSDIANGTTGLVYSRSGESLGNTTFAYSQRGWSVYPGNGSQPLANIIYNNAVPNQTWPRGDSFSATCKGNYTRNCTIGALAENPVSVLNGSSANTKKPEFTIYPSLEITSLVPFSVFNMTSISTAAWTTYAWYQGIGQVYPPLGIWTLDGTEPIIQVVWSTSSFGACQGLEVFLSGDHEGIAWLVFGYIWQWWMMWGNNDGGCINWPNSTVDVGIGVPLDGG